MIDIYKEARTAIIRSTQDVLRIINPSYSSVDVINAHGNGPEPKNTFCVVNIIDVQQEGSATHSTFIPDSPDGEEMWFSVNHRVFAQFSFIGEKAGEYAFNFRHHLVNNVVCREAFQRNSLSPGFKSALRNAPQRRETKWVEGFNMDVDFGFIIQTRQEIEWVEFITVNGQPIRISEP